MLKINISLNAHISSIFLCLFFLSTFCMMLFHVRSNFILIGGIIGGWPFDCSIFMGGVVSRRCYFKCDFALIRPYLKKKVNDALTNSIHSECRWFLSWSVVRQPLTQLPPSLQQWRSILRTTTHQCHSALRHQENTSHNQPLLPLSPQKSPAS